MGGTWMKQWNGLVRKEWLTMKWPLLVSALIGVTVMIVVPLLLTSFSVLEVPLFEITLVICFLWAIASVLAPVVALFMMLGMEMKRPDVWLHSHASIFTLIGSKAFLAAVIGAGGLLIPTLVLAVQYAYWKPAVINFDEMLFYGSLFIIIIFALSISLMSTGFFFWVLDRLMKPYLKGFSVVVTIILFIFASWGFTKLTLSSLYSKLVLVGPIDLMSLKNSKLDLTHGYLEITETVIYTGEVVFDLVITIALFVIAAVLFEKKVRL